MLTWLEINKKALLYNVALFRKIIGSKRLLMPVIKANAYGHGLLEVAKICAASKEVNRLCVVNLEEALQLIAVKIKKPIFILGIYELDNKKITVAAKHNVIFPLYTFEQMHFLNKVGEKSGKKIKVHVKIDTGTSRIGVLPRKAVHFVREIRKCKHLILEGIWSHFSSSENDQKVTERQYVILNDVEKSISTQLNITIPYKHMACSASAMLYKHTQLNAVRFGIGLYGLHPDKNTNNVPLKPVLSWKTKVLQVKNIPKGTKISYNGTYTTKRPSTIAVLPVGYADGLPRSLSNKGSVLIQNKICPIRGRICMNLCMVDVTGLKIKEGDTVTIIGKNKTVDQLAAEANTINYEIVARISPHLPRIIV